MMEYRILTEQDTEAIVVLGCELNPILSEEIIRERLQEMLSYDNYTCFGVFIDEQLAGIVGGWMTTRFYSGRQLELDNLVVSSELQSQGIGAKLMNYVEAWAEEQGCLSVELNTYVANSASHKFYFNQGHTIIGYHFHKALNNREC